MEGTLSLCPLQIFDGQFLEGVIRYPLPEASPADIVADLTKAKETFQFTQAITGVKLAIPQALLVDGNNPLLLLHATLSSGIHDKSDDECLELARSIRIVLAGLVERIDQALSEKKEPTEAVSKLLKAKAEKGKTKASQQQIGQPDAQNDAPR